MKYCNMVDPLCKFWCHKLLPAPPDPGQGWSGQGPRNTLLDHSPPSCPGPGCPDPRDENPKYSRLCRWSRTTFDGVEGGSDRDQKRGGESLELDWVTGGLWLVRLGNYGERQAAGAVRWSDRSCSRVRSMNWAFWIFCGGRGSRWRARPGHLSSRRVSVAVLLG